MKLLPLITGLLISPSIYATDTQVSVPSDSKAIYFVLEAVTADAAESD